MRLLRHSPGKEGRLARGSPMDHLAHGTHRLRIRRLGVCRSSSLIYRIGCRCLCAALRRLRHLPHSRRRLQERQVSDSSRPSPTCAATSASSSIWRLHTTASVSSNIQWLLQPHHHPVAHTTASNIQWLLQLLRRRQQHRRATQRQQHHRAVPQHRRAMMI